MLCRLEGKTHPRHWLELIESHTPYEWAMQRAMALIEPFGEDRADIRAAHNTVVGKSLTAENFDESWNVLTNYTGDETEDEGELEFDPDALAKIKDKS